MKQMENKILHEEGDSEQESNGSAVPKYLQKVDLDALKRETGKTLEELAELADIGPKVIYKWKYMHKNSSRPSYNAMVRLFEIGATVETLFGVQYKAGVKVVERPATDEQVETAVKRVLSRLTDDK